MLSLERQNEWREQYRAANPGWRPATEVYAAQVRAHVRPGGRWLDLGCGRGGLVEQLAHDPSLTIGIDPDWPSLREHRLPGMLRAAALSDRPPFAPATFDVVTASWLLEHLPRPEVTFHAVARLLRPGGVFIFITPNARHPLAWANRLAGRLGRLQGQLVDRIYARSEADTFSTHYRANSPAHLAELAGKSGLTLTHFDLIEDPSYLAFNRVLFEAMSQIDARLPADRRIHLVGVMEK